MTYIMQLLYPLRIKPSLESEHNGDSKEQQVSVEIDQPEEILLLETKPKKEASGTVDHSIQFQAVEDAKMTRNVQNGFWVK